jgi:hypothetical protein
VTVSLDPLGAQSRTLFDQSEYEQDEAARRKEAIEAEKKRQEDLEAKTPLVEQVITRNMLHVTRPYIGHTRFEPWRKPQHHSQPLTFNTRTVYPVHPPTAAGVHFARDLSWGTDALLLAPIPLAEPIGFKDRRAAIKLLGTSHRVLMIGESYVPEYPSDEQQKRAITVEKSEMGQIISLMVRKTVVPPTYLGKGNEDKLADWYLRVAKFVVSRIKSKAKEEGVDFA